MNENRFYELFDLGFSRIAQALEMLGNGEAENPGGFGATERVGMALIDIGADQRNALDGIAMALESIATAMEKVADALRERNA